MEFRSEEEAMIAKIYEAMEAASAAGRCGMRAPVDVLAVMDLDRRAVALLSDEYYDAGKFNLAEKWSDHLSAHDEARAAVAKLIEKSAAALPGAKDGGEEDVWGRR